MMDRNELATTTSSADLHHDARPDVDLPGDRGARHRLRRHPLLCASEIDVPGSMPRCIRILIHLYTTRPEAIFDTSTFETLRACVMTSPNSRHAHVVGLGLIGASVALALTETGWSVTAGTVTPRRWPPRSTAAS